MFALGGEGRHELERVVASDYSRAQINVKLQSMSSDLVLQQVEEADRLAKAAFAGTGISVLTTGSGRLFSTLDHYLVDSQLSSFGTAFLTVFGVIFIVFRSWRFGALTICPNLLPVIAVLGVMGYLDISMNIATVMVASVALGVVDDDTIHFINRYRREVAAGASTDEAIERATIHEGRASLTTAIINSCGFAVLFLSEYKPTAWFGGLLALTMAVAFLAEVFILPPMIKLLPRIFGAEALRGGRAAAAAAARCSPPGAGGDRGTRRRSSARPGTSRSPATGSRTRRCGGAASCGRALSSKQKADPSERSALQRLGICGRASRPPSAGDPGDDATVTARSRGARSDALELRLGRLDLYAGYGRVVWGRSTNCSRPMWSIPSTSPFLLRGAQRGAAAGGGGARPLSSSPTTCRSKASTCRSSGAGGSIS